MIGKHNYSSSPGGLFFLTEVYCILDVSRKYISQKLNDLSKRVMTDGHNSFLNGRSDFMTPIFIEVA